MNTQGNRRMDQINVQRWASSLRQFHRNYFQPPNVNDVCVGTQNGVRNASTTTKTRENELPIDNHKYSFTLGEKRNFINNSMSEASNRTVKPEFYVFDIPTKDEENLHSSINAQFSAKHRDIDTLSDTGTYIIEDDESEPITNSSSSLAFKRYGDQIENRRGTFDIHGTISSTAHTINRPSVDANIPRDNLLSSSSNSSVHSFNEDEGISENKSYLQKQSTLTSQEQIKPAECFVISPTTETKSIPTTNAARQKVEVPSKSKTPTKSVSSKDPNPGNSTTRAKSPPQSARSNQNFFQLQKQPSSLKPSIRPHTATTAQTSSFQHQRQTVSSLSSVNSDETTPNITKVSANKSFVFRQQRPNLAPSTAKPLSRQPLKSLPSAPISTTNPSSQTNRAVELRRARAQAKIEELSQGTKKPLQKPNHSIDIMSASWHSNASNTNKKDFTNLRTAIKTNVPSKQQNLSATRTISSAAHHRSSSVSPNPLGQRHDQQYQKMNASTHSFDEDRCDSLRNNGQRLAIKLIQLSSGILEKLKPNDDVSVRELEQLVDKLQTVNRTLTSIDASLPGPTNDDAFE